MAGRDIILYPDLSKAGTKVNFYEAWCAKAEQLNRLVPGSFFQVSPLLEENATEEDRNQGLDLADFLIRLNHKDFQVSGVRSELTAGVAEQHDLEHVNTSAPEPAPIVPTGQASFEKLKAKYSTIATLAERLELEVVS